VTLYRWYYFKMIRSAVQSRCDS